MSHPQVFKRYCIVCEKRLYGSMGVGFRDGVSGGTQISDTPGYGSKFDCIGSLSFCICDSCLEEKGKKGFIAITKRISTPDEIKWKLWNINEDAPFECLDKEWLNSEIDLEGDISHEEMVDQFDKLLPHNGHKYGWGVGSDLDENDDIVYTLGFGYGEKLHSTLKAPTRQKLVEQLKEFMANLNSTNG